MINNMYFADIPAALHLKSRLLYMAKQKQVPHANLFHGPSGNAALPLAFAFTAYLNCHQPLEEDACRTCKSCIQLAKLKHPDVKFIFPTNLTTANNTPETSISNLVPTWSSFLEEQPYGNLLKWSNYLGTTKNTPFIAKASIAELSNYIVLKPHESNYKINIIWLPESMHPAAAQALLKILEEPRASHIIFLLISHEPDSLLSTIRSRLQQMYIPAFTDQAIKQIITERYQHQLSPDTEIATIVKLSAGNAQKAYELISETQNEVLQQFVSWMRVCYAYDFGKIISLVDVFQEYDKATQKHFFTYSLFALRQIWIARLQVGNLLEVQQAEKRTIEKLGEILDECTIQNINQWIHQAYYYLERNLNTRIVFLNLSLQIAQVFKSIRQQKHV